MNEIVGLIQTLANLLSSVHYSCVNHAPGHVVIFDDFFIEIFGQFYHISVFEEVFSEIHDTGGVEAEFVKHPRRVFVKIDASNGSEDCV